MILFSLTKESVSIPSTGRDHAHGDCLRLYSGNGLRFSCSELEIEDENKQTFFFLPKLLCFTEL